MGGKSGKSATVGYWYLVAYHAGLGVGPMDAFVEFRGGDKTAWNGELTSSGTITINAPNLWGGEKDQGGIVGDVDVMFGEATQQPNAYLLANLGPQVPAWRGLSTLVFKGGKYGAMNPYPQKASYKIRKIKKGWDNDVCWYPEKAAIPMGTPKSVALFFAIDLSGSMDTVAGNGQTRLTNMKNALNSVLDQVGEAVATGTVIDLMIVGFGEKPNGRISTLERGVTAAGITNLKNWVSARVSQYGTYFTAGVMDMPAFYNGAPPTAQRLAFFLTDGEPNVSDGSMTALQIAQEAGNIINSVASVSSYAVNIDLGNTTYTAYVDNTPGDAIPVVASGDPSAIVGIIRAAIFGGVTAMNPAHVLYYARTTGDIGREPVANMNDASWRAAANQLYAEGFGICTSYDPVSESLEEFEQRISRLIGGSVSRSLVDGQWYLDLARNNYVLAELPVLTDDDILEFSEQPSTLDGAINSLSVKYFDPERKETIVMAPVQALGLINAFGTIHQTNEYLEIPAGTLAGRVAERDLRATVTPTRAFELTTTRKPYAWRPNQYFRLQLPKRGIADMVCILGEKSSGTLRSGAIKLKATQDIYSLPSTTFVEVEPGVDTRPSQTPVAITFQRAFEAPYIEVVQSLSRADLAALPSDVGYLVAVAADPALSRDFTVKVSPDAVTYTEVGNGEWCPTAVVINQATSTATNFTLASRKSLDRVTVGSAVLWDNEICRVDALDNAAGTIVLGRGCADTVPTPHAAGSRLWFYDAAVAASVTEYTAAETISVKLLTNTGSKQLAESAATAMSVDFDQRLFRPYPPHQLKVNNSSAPVEVSGAFNVTWVHRDRVLQADQLVDTTMASIGPEPGTSYDLEVRGSVSGELI
ncbi:MAG TPA: vWA domain-containing protein, partial [Pseudoxanthomonas sp.]|nr:vWA domain-containing protein [Pseudoxanthomonas sp.]